MGLKSYHLNISMKTLVSIAWAGTLKMVFYSLKFICWYFPRQTCYTWDDKTKPLIFSLYKSTHQLQNDCLAEGHVPSKQNSNLSTTAPLKQIGNFRHTSLTCIAQYKQILLEIYLKLYTDVLSTSEQRSGNWCLEEKAKNKALHKAGSKRGK